MKNTSPPDKRLVVRLLLKREGRVMLCVDTTRDGVEVPRRFHGDPGLRLILNQNMPQPIHVGPNAIESELRFGGVPHYCIIPYHALWAAFNPDSYHGAGWEDAMPPPWREQMMALLNDLKPLPEEWLEHGPSRPAPALVQAAPLDAPGEGDAAGEEKPRLQVIQGNQHPPAPGRSPNSPPRKGHLKLVE